MQGQEEDRSSARTTQAFVEAMRHPLRRKLFRFAVEREEPASPAMASRELEEQLSTVSYHYRVLLDAGLVDLHSTRPNRGAVEHLYLPVAAAVQNPVVKSLLEG